MERLPSKVTNAIFLFRILSWGTCSISSLIFCLTLKTLLSDDSAKDGIFPHKCNLSTSLICVSLRRVLKAKVKCLKVVSERPRISREKKTIEAMVRIYCKNHQRSKADFCAECSELAEYAKMRLDKCPF
jgi:hypothetical protein